MGSSPLLFPAGRIAMKILIVSGFLGAGKTTFIRHLTDTLPQVDFAIFENEIGETDLDAKVLRDGDRSLNVYEMTENCVCCTGKADFLTNLMTILSALDPEVLIVEPTGAARLSALMGAIEGLQYDALELLPTLTLVDAGTFFRERMISVSCAWTRSVMDPYWFCPNRNSCPRKRRRFTARNSRNWLRRRRSSPGITKNGPQTGSGACWKSGED